MRHLDVCQEPGHGHRVVVGQDGLAHHLEHPEGRLLLLGDEQQQPRDVVEALAVADPGVQHRERHQDVEEGTLETLGVGLVEVDVKTSNCLLFNWFTMFWPIPGLADCELMSESIRDNLLLTVCRLLVWPTPNKPTCNSKS